MARADQSLPLITENPYENQPPRRNALLPTLLQLKPLILNRVAQLQAEERIGDRLEEDEESKPYQSNTVSEVRVAMLSRALEDALEEESNFEHPDFKEALFELIEQSGVRVSNADCGSSLNVQEFFEKLERRRPAEKAQEVRRRVASRAQSERDRNSLGSAGRPVTALSFASSASFTSSFSRRMAQLSRVG